MQNTVSAPLRSQAIQYLQNSSCGSKSPELSTSNKAHSKKSKTQFQPYGHERSSLGGLIGGKTDVQKYFLPLHKLKISLMVKPGVQSSLVRGKNIMFFAKGNNNQSRSNLDSSSMEQYLTMDSKDIEYNFAKLIEQQPKKEFMGRQTFLEQKGKRILSLQGISSQNLNIKAPLVQNPDKWKMCIENKDITKTILKSDKPQKVVSKRIHINPGIGQYFPEWEKIHPRSTQNVYISKTDMNSAQKSVKQIPLRVDRQQPKINHSTNDSQIQMYASLQSQVLREVKLSMKASPQSQHPFIHLSMKPLDEKFIEDGKNSVNEKLAQTRRTKQKLNFELQKTIQY